jgi:hypothetical protein
MFYTINSKKFKENHYFYNDIAHGTTSRRHPWFVGYTPKL